MLRRPPRSTRFPSPTLFRSFEVHVTSRDVIHSFWLPRLGGKIDAIPGQVNIIRLQVAEPGVYRGQCAEFCGVGHAAMSFTLQAHAAGDAP